MNPVIDIDNYIERIPESGCWIWMGYVSKSGYGQFTYKKSTQRAHRLVYSLLVGEIPYGLQIDHKCRVRCCVNPSHLEPVTQKENIIRGISPPANNSRLTHCKHGHEFSPENTETRRGFRQCKTCIAKEKHEYWLRHRNEWNERSKQWHRAKRSAAKNADTK